MLPTEEARLRRWPRHNCAPSGCAPTHAICWRPRNPHRPRPTKQRPSSPRFPPCEAFERRPPAARPTVVQGAGVRNPSAHRTAGIGRVEMWRGDVRLSMSVSAPFVWRCLSGSAVAPFPHPAHRTGHADFPHPALGQDLTPSSTARRAQAGSGARVRSARRGARVDSSRPRLTLCLRRNHRRNRIAA